MFETSICSVPSISQFGASIFVIIDSKSGVISLSGSSIFTFDIPFFADAYITGKSSWSSSAPSSINSSNTPSTAFSGFAPGLSILFTTTIGFNPKLNDFLSTVLVCGIVPSYASTKRSTPSTILSTLSTSPPKSACPGVSTIFIFISLYITDVFLAKIVIPLSFSCASESITLSSTCSFVLNTPLCFNNSFTSVVFPWSTWAIIAIFLIFSFLLIFPSFT